MVGGISACKLGHLFQDAVHRIDYVGAGYFEDDDQDGVFEHAAVPGSIDPCQPSGSDVGNGVGHGPKVGDTHRRSGLPVIAGDNGTEIGGFENLIVGVDLPAVFGVFEIAFRAIGVGAGKCGAHGFESDAVAAELHGIELNADRRLRASAYKYLTDALNLRDALRQNRVCHVINLWLGHYVRGQRENQNRGLGGVGLAIARDSAASMPAIGCERR